MNYAHNYLQASEAAYGLQSSDLPIVIIARHVATVFAYGDAMWAKYGTPLSQMINFTDRKTKEPPSVNVCLAHIGRKKPASTFRHPRVQCLRSLG